MLDFVVFFNVSIHIDFENVSDGENASNVGAFLASFLFSFIAVSGVILAAALYACIAGASSSDSDSPSDSDARFAIRRRKMTIVLAFVLALNVVAIAGLKINEGARARGVGDAS